jgi:hypothetical protein
VHRITVSARAYRAIKATLPPGSVVYPPERNGRGAIGVRQFWQGLPFFWQISLTVSLWTSHATAISSNIVGADIACYCPPLD